MYLSIDKKAKKDIFVSIFQLLKNTSRCINLIFNHDHLFIQGMDGSHICLFEINIQSKWFYAYQEEKENKDAPKGVSISLDTIMFQTVLSMCADSDILSLIHEKGKEYLEIDLETSDGKKKDYSKNFHIPLIDYDAELMSIPDIEYEAEFIIDSKKMNEVTSQLLIFGNVMDIHCSEEKINLISSGTNGEMKVSIPIDDLTEYSISEDDKIDTSYSLSSLSKMCLSNKLSNEIQFSISKEYPMRIKYDLGDDSFIRFFLAPRVND